MNFINGYIAFQEATIDFHKSISQVPAAAAPPPARSELTTIKSILNTIDTNLGDAIITSLFIPMLNASE